MWNSLPVLNAIAFWALWTAGIAGGIAAVAGLAGGLAAIRASDITGKVADNNIAIANRRAAEANARAELARLETAKISAGLSWRELTSEQVHRAAAVLKGIDFDVWLSYVGDDPEAANLREQVQKAFDLAGVKAKFFSGWAQSAGVSVLGHAGAERDKIVEALEAAGLHPIAKPPIGGFGKNFPCIVIGTKPERL